MVCAAITVPIVHAIAGTLLTLRNRLSTRFACQRERGWGEGGASVSW